MKWWQALRLPLHLPFRFLWASSDLECMQTQGEPRCETGVDESMALHHQLG